MRSRWCSCRATNTGVNQKWNEAVSNSRRLRQVSADTQGSDPPYLQPCVFPFTYGGVTYTACTNTDHTAPWCSTKVGSLGNHIPGYWGECAPANMELFQTGGSSSTRTCTSSGYHVCAADANFGVVKVDWTAGTVRMSIRTPHHTGQVEFGIRNPEFVVRNS